MIAAGMPCSHGCGRRPASCSSSLNRSNVTVALGCQKLQRHMPLCLTPSSPFQSLTAAVQHTMDIEPPIVTADCVQHVQCLFLNIDVQSPDMHLDACTATQQQESYAGQ